MTGMAARFRVGCSGWHYWHWAGRVYPKEMPTTERWLHAYTTRFDTVELNNSFYRYLRRSSSTAGGGKCRVASSSPSKPAAF